MKIRKIRNYDKEDKEDKKVWPGDGLCNCRANGNCKEEEESICWSVLRPSQKNAVWRKKKQS